MNILSFHGIDILGISACVPKTLVENSQFGKDLFPDEAQLKKTIETIGVVQRRVCNDSMCTSDLCYAAAESIIEEMNVDRSEIDVVIFVSQTPDYKLPATSVLLQNRLGLSNKTISFDVNLGCSGYVYGLSIAYSFAKNDNIRKVLLLVGDSPTKFVSKQDTSSALLFGDAGSATLIEDTGSNSNTFFNLYSDGSGSQTLIIPSGGYRNISSVSSLESKIDDDGNARNQEQLFMSGGDIFNFTLREVPRSIKELLDFSKTELQDIDQFVFHQANKFMIEFLRKKIKIDTSKFVMSLENYGNTSSTSIPLTLVINNDDIKYGQTLLSGFGVGLSWGNCYVNLGKTKIIKLLEI